MLSPTAAMRAPSALLLLLAAFQLAGERAPAARPVAPAGVAELRWTVVSTENGGIEPPFPGTQQTSSVVGDFDGDRITDFAIMERTAAPAVVWYRRHADGWTRGVVDPRQVPIEAGAIAADVDRDGDLDLVAGGDAQSAEVWWWENPGPALAGSRPWPRWTLKAAGGKKHHDLAFGDVDGDGRDELVFWNQGARTLFLAEVPARPRSNQPWRLTPIFVWSADGQPEQRSRRPEPAWKKVNEHEGLALADVNGDGQLDIAGGGYWFTRRSDPDPISIRSRSDLDPISIRSRSDLDPISPGMAFIAHPIDPGYTFTRTAVGQLVEGGRPEVVLVAGDGTGPLMYYEWTAGTWLAHQLLDEVQDGHSLALADLDRDGHLDIFVAEMRVGGRNPESKMYLLRGDSRGHFRPAVLGVGHDLHEAKLADLDGDGRLDILAKPYNHGTPGLAVWLQR